MLNEPPECTCEQGRLLHGQETSHHYWRGSREQLFKVIVIGDPTVGKTSYIRRYVQNLYQPSYKGTVGVDFALKIVRWTQNQIIKLQLWDIAGQERFTWMTRVYYKESQGCVIMFDLTNRNSFENVIKWKQDLDSKCNLEDGNFVPCILLANKCDLYKTRTVEQSEIERICREYNFIGWTETSAKSDLMIEDSMKFLIEVMLKQNSVQPVDFGQDSLKLEQSAVEMKKSACRC